MAQPPDAREGRISLCDALDRALHKGVALRTEIAISVAGVDLVYLDLRALLASTDTARRLCRPAPLDAPAGSAAP